jgi:hypothetical protein
MVLNVLFSRAFENIFSIKFIKKKKGAMDVQLSKFVHPCTFEAQPPVHQPMGEDGTCQ